MKSHNLTIKELLHKKFNTELSGYSAAEVDQYLDYILEDYQLFEAEITKLKALVSEKKALVEDKNDEIEKLKLELINLQDQLAEANKNTNYTLVKKIEELTELTKSNLK